MPAENKPGEVELEGLETESRRLEAQGKTLLFVWLDGRLLGFLAAADTLRPEVPQALQKARRLGIRHIELLTGDNASTAAAQSLPDLGILANSSRLLRQ